MRDYAIFEKAKIERIEEDVLLTTYRKKSVLSISEAIEMEEEYLRIANGEKMFFISDLTAEGSDLTNDAQVYFSRKARIVPSVKAAAIVINNLKSRLVARFYIQYFKPAYPTKIFASADEAKIWFASLRQQDLVEA